MSEAKCKPREFWIKGNNVVSPFSDSPIHVVEYSAYEKRDAEAKHFCRLYNEALDEIIKLKTKLGEDPGDY